MVDLKHKSFASTTGAPRCRHLAWMTATKESSASATPYREWDERGPGGYLVRIKIARGSSACEAIRARLLLWRSLPAWVNGASVRAVLLLSHHPHLRRLAQGHIRLPSEPCGPVEPPRLRWQWKERLLLLLRRRRPILQWSPSSPLGLQYVRAQLQVRRAHPLTWKVESRQRWSPSSRLFKVGWKVAVIRKRGQALVLLYLCLFLMLWLFKRTKAWRLRWW